MDRATFVDDLYKLASFLSGSISETITMLPSKLLACVIGVLAAQASSKAPDNVLDSIDPLIGTINGGHVFPGATLPFGMAKAGPDTDGDNQGGFDSASTLVTGFSHMHDSGTGGGASMGNFPIFPQGNCPDDNITNCKFSVNDRSIGWKKDSIRARAGYFALSLDNSIFAEMTVTNHSALYRFTYPETPKETLPLNPLILVDTIDLSRSRATATLTIDPETGRTTGRGHYSPSFGTGRYTLYFCTDVKGASIRDIGTFQEAKPELSETEARVVGRANSGGTFVRFNTPEKDNQILVRVGLSFISVEKACANAENENPDFDFEATVATAEAEWKKKLDVVSIKTGGVDRDFEVMFWSGIYRTMISPQDYTDENPLWESDEPYYDSFYCIWDSFRTIHPLLTILDPHSQTLIVRSLIDIYRHTGYLPDCRMTFCKGYTQGGSNADSLLVDSFVKGLTDGIDWVTGYQALLKDARVQPPNWLLEGRGGIQFWNSLGYIPIDGRDSLGTGLYSRSVSRSVEYAYNDFCIAQVSKARGHKEDYETFSKSAENWQNLFKENQTSAINGVDTGFVGFMQPRLLDGSWAYQDPIRCSPLLEPHSCYLNADGGESYEGSLWLYTFYVPQDMASLVKTLGGPKKFTSRLDFLHESGLHDMGNEPAFLPVYQYHYAGRPGLSAHRAHAYIPSQFNHSLGGIPGNDDGGAMGSFIAFAMLGLYPVAGQDVYLITPPFFEEVSILNSATGKVATIRNVNFDPKYEAIYIQSAKLNGKPWHRNWLGHDFFRDGGVLELRLGRKESKWGTREKDLPPSMSTGGFF
ncbi:hypothetical protein AJ80_02382 [Polytolypa hystricis UAMH7299]|uniref:Alpha-1,2-mannosidase n=1 Tax=Polytolypa hystricis (strain UAMH7299) TaxID=1447883 RepID=A0A2B7YRB6_POLH7|nr:hypothetical protein AJ80_02382 [Polytolypa hystricis UAMH7299]